MNHFEKFESYIPVDLLSVQSFVIATLVVFLFVTLRYFLFVLMFYYPFWLKKSVQSSFLSLHDQKVKDKQISFEIKYSILASFIFAVSGYLMGVFWQFGWSQIYLPFDQYGYWYLPVSFFIYSLVHEFYFYWTHVWMHQPRIYKYVHAIHHHSVKTSPWASFSFHPLECLIHALFLPLLVLVVPIHPTVLILYLTFMTLTAISNHLGVELLKSKFLKRHFISGTHHALHHKRFRYNFGLYYTFLDRWMGTELEDF